MKVMQRTRVQRYGVGILSSLVALALTLWLRAELDRAIFAFFIGAVMISATYGGFRAGMLAAVIGAVSAVLIFIVPAHSFLSDGSGVVQVLIFLFITTMISALSEARSRAAQRAYQSQQWLATTIRSIGDAVIATDSAGCVTFMNQVAQNLTGWLETEASGRKLVDIFNIVNEGTGLPVDNPVEKVLQQGVIVGLANHTVLIARDGREIPIEDSAAPIRDGAGRISGVILVFHDVSERRRAELEQQFLYKSGELLASSLDYELTLARFAHLAVPRVADWCAVDILAADGSVVRLAVAHVDQAKVEWAHELHRRYPASPEATTGVYGVLRSGRSEFYPHITDEMLCAGALDEEHLGIMRSIGFTSVMIVPLVVREKVFGAISFVSAESGRRYTDADLAFAEELARKAALAIENARLYRDAEEAAEKIRRHAARLTIMAETTNAFAQVSLDYARVLDTVARQIAELLGDVCTIRLRSEDGVHVEPGALYHPDATTMHYLRELFASAPQKVGEGMMGRVVQTGEVVLVPVVDEEQLRNDISPEFLSYFDYVTVSSLMVVPLRARGEVIGAVSIVRDTPGHPFTEDDCALIQEIADRAALVIENARLYHRAEEQREWFKVTLASIGDAVIATDTAGRITFMNPVSHALTGWGDDAIGHELQDVFTIFNEYTREPVESPVAKVLREGRIVGLANHTVLIARDGHEVPIDDSAAPIRDGAGNLRGVVMVFHDITDRKEIERQLKDAKENAEAANSAKDQFLAVLSHELRTPLTPVLATAQAMESDLNLPRDFRPLIEIIRRNVELEVHLIDDLLDLVRVAKGKLQLHQEVIDSNVLLNNVLEICRGEIYGKKLRLTVGFHAEDRFVRGDPARLQQVFWNLLKNAVKFTPAGGTVMIRTFNPRPGYVAVEINDSGIGIDPDLLPRIFNAFEQGEQTVTRKFGGLGLGLAITRGLVEMHGGTITAWSQGKNQGTTFTVELVSVAPARPPAGTRVDTGRPRQEKECIRILIVDDHEDTNNVMKLLLERHGYQVKAATSVRGALELAADMEFDLLVSDIGLPDGSGLDLVRALHAKRPVKAIALSGFGMEGDIQKSKEAGFSEHLTKPVTFRKLQEVIQQLLG